MEVSDEVARQYRESLKEEWRSEAYEKYYSKSLEGIVEAGRDFEDERADVEEMLAVEESERIRSSLLKNLHKALDTLLPEQRELITEIYFNGATQREIYPDNITTILTVCVEEYIGSLMCNYFQEDFEVSYWENKIYLGYTPISYDEEQINLYSPLRSYNATVNKLDIAVISRLNEYKRKKDARWADNRELSLYNSKKILNLI